MARIRYAEGDWFAVPLRDGGFAVGVVARANKNGVLLGYFFGPRQRDVPSLDDVEELVAKDAVLIKKFGDLGLKSGKWPLLGSAPSWNRDEWPMPTFGRFEELTGLAFAVEYSSDDPNSHPRETPILQEDLVRYPKDGLGGAGFIEITLTELLT
jgi:hypothetical protein